MMNELQHHGIKGQKWGVRRFQNPDGSWTAAGRERYGSGKSRTPSGDDIILKKGSAAYRMANEGEKYEKNKPKYMSIDEEDRKVYKGQTLEGLFVDWTKNIGEYENEFKKDVVVRSGKNAISDIIKKYGNENTDSLLKDLDNVEALRTRIKDKDDRSFYLERHVFDQDYDKNKASYENTRLFVWNMMKYHHDDLVSDWKKKGYDATIDPYDYIENIADRPIIVFDPKSTVKQKKYKRVYEALPV